MIARNAATNQKQKRRNNKIRRAFGPERVGLVDAMCNVLVIDYF
jgi:hypothetical protein